MGKSADAFRTISEVAEWLGLPTHVLRFWESKFAQVKPVKRAGGRRYYRPGDMLLLGGIKKLLHDDGMTIKGVQKILRTEGIAPVAQHSQPLDDVTAAEFSQTTEDPTPPTARPDPEQIAAFKSDSPPPLTPAGPEDEPAALPPSEEKAPGPEVESPASANQAAAKPAPEADTPDPQAPPEPALPGFTPAPTETESAPMGAETEALANRTPATLAPAKITVSDDPGDDFDVAPGLLSRLSGIPRPLTPEAKARLTTILAHLKKIGSPDRPTSEN